MEAENIQRRIYPGFGCCIYCGSDGGDDGLRDEHIMPYCLGGNAVIREASCKACEAETSYLDGYLGRKVFYELRVHSDIQTRNPKNRPTHLKATLQVAGELEVRSFPAKEQPYAVALPVWDIPGVLVGRAPTTAFPGEGKHFFYYVPESLQAELPQGQFLVNAASNTTTFARAIMKIAYCHAVAELGLDGFRRLVSPQIILGQYSYVSHFIGCKLDQPPPPLASNQMHAVQRSTITFGRMRLLMQAVRLFGSSGTKDRGLTVYYAIVGAPRIT
jgi:HNH endonuclease